MRDNYLRKVAWWEIVLDGVDITCMEKTTTTLSLL